MEQALLREIQGKVKERDYQFTLHAGNRMTERHISVREVEEALLSISAEVIGNYPESIRRPSCLILGTTGNGRALHLQCTYPPDIAVITAYEPKPDEWIDRRTRKG